MVSHLLFESILLYNERYIMLYTSKANAAEKLYTTTKYLAKHKFSSLLI